MSIETRFFAGARFPSEKSVYIDKLTGIPITVLTDSDANDQKIYQDHPQWTHEGEWIIFRSNRGSADGKTMQAFAVRETSGEIVQLSDAPGLLASTLNVARLSGRLFFLREGKAGATDLVELDTESLLSESSGGRPRPSADYERIVCSLPRGMRESGGFALDAGEKSAYLGARAVSEEESARKGPPPPRAPGEWIAQHPSCIKRIDLATGAMETVVETPFLMGHVQSNPWVPGEIVFCHETGGDAPQRMWTFAEGSPHRPLYLETPDEWVTHEAVVARDEVMFAIMGHLPRLRTKPTGIAAINLRTNEMKIIGQCDSGNGFWHVNGSCDGRWAVGDNFDGDIILIDRENGASKLLTTDHKMKPDHAHPTFDPGCTRILFQSGLLRNGACLNLMTVAVPHESGLSR